MTAHRIHSQGGFRERTISLEFPVGRDVAVIEEPSEMVGKPEAGTKSLP